MESEVLGNNQIKIGSAPTEVEVCEAFMELGAEVAHPCPFQFIDAGSRRIVKLISAVFPALAGVTQEKYQIPHISEKAKSVLARLDRFSIEEYPKLARIDPTQVDLAEIMVVAPPDTLIKLLSSRIFPLHSVNSSILIQTTYPSQFRFKTGRLFDLDAIMEMGWFRPISLQFCKETGYIDQLKVLKFTNLEYCVPSLDITPWVLRTLEISIDELNFYANCFGMNLDLTQRPIMLGDLAQSHRFSAWSHHSHSADQFFDSIIIPKLQDKLENFDYAKFNLPWHYPYPGLFEEA